MNTKIIALSGDSGYLNQITTTIKSIAYHNNDFKIYIINGDIPQEWFENLNRYLTLLKGKVVDLKIDINILAEETPTNHEQINQMTFGKLLIPNLIQEDKVLYIDSDAVVNNDLSELFETNINKHPLAAVKDVFGEHFNAGVLLINNKKLRNEYSNIVTEFLEYGKTEGLLDGDQSILNHFFYQSYLQLPLKYNYVIGYDRDVYYAPSNAPEYFDLINRVNKPIIVHYPSADKPWNLTSAGRARKLWWFYHNLEWNEIILRENPRVTNNLSKSLFTFTYSDVLHHIDEIIQSLPNIQFIIAAYTKMSFNLLRLSQYPNVRLIPSISGPLLNYYIKSCDGYLDINEGDKETQFIELFKDKEKPIYSFSSIKADIDDSYPNHYIFADNQIDKMIQSINTK